MIATAGMLPLFKHFNKSQRNISCLLSRVSLDRYSILLIHANKNLGWGMIANHVGRVTIRTEDSEIWRFILAARRQAGKAIVERALKAANSPHLRRRKSTE